MTRLIQVGNSLGVRIPKALITQVGFKEDTDLLFKVTDEGLLISPINHSREGWAECFKAAQKEEDLLMGTEMTNQFDQDEWEW